LSHLILIRHSATRQVPGISSPLWELSDEGRKRCRILADHLRPYRVATIASSDEAKAISTASILAEAIGIASQIIVEPDFRETRRETVPYYESVSDFREAIRAAMLSPNRVVFGEESFAEARARFNTALHRLVTLHPGKTLAVVTHGTVMSLVVGQASGLDAYSTWKSLEMPAYAVFTPNLDLLDLKHSVG